MKKKTKKSPSLRKLKAKAWTLWSVYIRSKHADFRGYVVCFTCKKTGHWREFHAGHYWHGKLDFDPRNIKPQCVKCNTYLSGNLDNYTMNLIEDMGIEAVKQLRADAARHPGYTRKELIEIINQLKNNNIQ